MIKSFGLFALGTAAGGRTDKQAGFEIFRSFVFWEKEGLSPNLAI